MGKIDERCPRCGAAPSSQRRKRRMIDFSVVDYIDNFNPVDGVKCNYCGYAFRAEGLDVEDDFVISDDTFECDPNYCPMCGAKVVES